MNVRIPAKLTDRIRKYFDDVEGYVIRMLERDIRLTESVEDESVPSVTFPRPVYFEAYTIVPDRTPGAIRCYAETEDGDTYDIYLAKLDMSRNANTLPLNRRYYVALAEGDRVGLDGEAPEVDFYEYPPTDDFSKMLGVKPRRFTQATLAFTPAISLI